MTDGKAVLLRHTVATLAYRGGKALRGAPAEFAGFCAGETTRTPAQILAHIGDLLDWALSLAQGREAWHNSPPIIWEKGTARFFAALEAFDNRLSAAEPLACSVEGLFQGPIADSFTHVGQIAMLRRLAGCPVRGENYLRAQIAVGRLGPEQAKPDVEFE
ncbi:MAG: hypothetical protein ACLQVL_14200 [Terriglobia bacterium]